jgi:hypothetical protein
MGALFCRCRTITMGTCVISTQRFMVVVRWLGMGQQFSGKLFITVYCCKNIKLFHIRPTRYGLSSVVSREHILFLLTFL